MNGLVAEFVVSRTVRDSAQMLDAVAGPALGDPYFAPPAAGRYRDAAARGSTRKLKIGIDSDLGGLHPECRSAITEAGKLCVALGHEVEPCVPPLRFSELRLLFLDVWAAGVSSAVMSIAGLTGRTPQPQQLEPLTYYLYERGRELSAAGYLVTITRLQQAARRLAAFHADYDLVLSAVTREPAPALGELVAGSPEQQLERAVDFVFDSPLANLVGNPAMSVPLHRCADGVPLGVHFSARVGEEELLFALASELEQAKPWSTAFPSIPNSGAIATAHLKEKLHVSHH
jgi:amidase